MPLQLFDWGVGASYVGNLMMIFLLQWSPFEEDYLQYHIGQKLSGCINSLCAMRFTNSSSRTCLWGTLLWQGHLGMDHMPLCAAVASEGLILFGKCPTTRRAYMEFR